MEGFLNKLDICFNNALLTKKTEQKMVILNKILPLLKCCRITTDLFNYLHSLNNELFLNFILNCKKPSFILLTYDLISIGNAINLSEDMYIVYYNNLFYAKYKPKSPISDSTGSIHSEWGH